MATKKQLLNELANTTKQSLKEDLENVGAKFYEDAYIKSQYKMLLMCEIDNVCFSDLYQILKNYGFKQQNDTLWKSDTHSSATIDMRDLTLEIELYSEDYYDAVDDIEDEEVYERR